MKSQLLQLIKDVPARKEDIMKAVISSPLSDPFRSKWLNDAVERAIKAAQGVSEDAQGLSEVPFWGNWATEWLSGNDRTAQSAHLAAQEIYRLREDKGGGDLKFWNHLVAAHAAYEAAHSHPSIIYCLGSSIEACEVVWGQLYDDMMKFISEMSE